MSSYQLSAISFQLSAVSLQVSASTIGTLRLNLNSEL